MSVQLRDGLAFGRQASVVINLCCPTGKSKSFTTKKSSWQDVWALRKCSPEISDLLVFCHKEVLPGYRVHMNATQNHSVEWVERLVRVPVFTKFSPWSSKRAPLRYSDSSIKAQTKMQPLTLGLACQQWQCCHRNFQQESSSHETWSQKFLGHRQSHTHIEMGSVTNWKIDIK